MDGLGVPGRHRAAEQTTTEGARLTLNPLKFANEVTKQYLRYQLTEHRLTDPTLGEQLEKLLWRNDSPLLKGPYVSISRAFEEGRSAKDLIQEKVLHPRMETIIPYESVYKHQEETLRHIEAGKDVLITTGTGSGKTESFLYPILNRILRNREKGKPKGVTALIVYPMNALATDQLERLRDLLVGSGITFGMYTGETPPEKADAEYSPKDVPAGTSRAAYRKLVQDSGAVENQILHPSEERYTRKAIQEDPPSILLTNTRMMEYLLSRADDLRFLRNAPLEFLVMDEAHTNSGAMGAEVALLIRRVKSIVQDQSKIQHLAASATIVDANSAALGKRFLSRLVGAREGNVEIVWESYQDLKWHDTPLRGQVPRDAEALNERTLKALDLEGDARTKELEAIYVELTNHELPAGENIEARLHEGFLRIDFARAIYETGNRVGELMERIQDAWTNVGRGHIRSQDQALRDARWEYLTYLALGAAAVKDDTPILRPKLHYFVKGLEDAVVVFILQEGKPYPELFLSRERALAKHADLDPASMFTIKSCPRCGQHHYEQYLDIEGLEDKDPLTGGTQVNGGAVYHSDRSGAKTRVLFTDRVMQESGEYDDAGSHKHEQALLCRFCGAIHVGSPTHCGSCERPDALVRIFLLNSVNKVTSCPVCGYGAGYNPGKRADPFRALAENTARNVYVLAQDMLSLAEPQSRKLIIFADNRQDAAFQAGSMRDNSRMFRLRQLILQYVRQPEEVQQGADGSVENLVDRLTVDMLKDEELARFVAPEVFEQAQEGQASHKRREHMKQFLAIQVLNELTRPYTDRHSLESLGRLSARYAGLDAKAEGVLDLAHRHGLKPTEVALWLETLLHLARHRRHFTHPLVSDLYAQSWDDKRNDLVAMRYVPDSDFRPGGLILEKEAEHRDSKASLQPFIGRNSAIETWAKNGLDLQDPAKRQAFLQDAWKFLTEDAKLLKRRQNLKWGNGRPIQGSSNVAHVHGGAMILTQSSERWDCTRCKRLHGHRTPNDACTAYRCTGKLEKVNDEVEPRDYDLVLLSRRRDLNSFVMAEEHTAQVPKGRRQEIERRFKKGNAVNTLVATPTLELGVDIGPLDIVLMRNVPPTPANYWQRAGRAGRRNRMAVIYTYARNNPHDLHYYANPSVMLAGTVQPPRFNLRNPVMVRKHVHAALLTQFQDEFRQGKADWVANIFPKRVGDVLFHENRLRPTIEDAVKDFQAAIQDERLPVMMKATFQAGWPDDPKAVADDVLTSYIQQAPDHLLAAYRRVWNRLRWATDQLRVLAAREHEGHTLGDDEVAFQRRCRALLRAFNPNQWESGERKSRQDQSYTLKVLATEGYLPGYATTSDSVTAAAHHAYSPGWERFEFELTRNATVAIREHIPGNRIYANGGKYRLLNYQFPADEEVRTPLDWKVHPITKAVRHVDDLGATDNTAEWTSIKSLPLVDSSLGYISRVDANETTRFRIASQVSGTLRGTHQGGLLYQFPDQVMEHRRGQDITLVNLGPLGQIDEEAMGFPICIDCGSTRSPYETELGLQAFRQQHAKLHGREPGQYALHANTTVDGLLLHDMPDAMHAASLGEGLRLAASQVLEMERDDLDWFLQPGADDRVDLFLYDSMPGGSGLLHQVTDNWKAVIARARELLTNCSGVCGSSCYHCLKTYYNQYWHDSLDRHAALESLGTLDKLPAPSPLDARRGVDLRTHEDTNQWEKTLEHVLREEWGFQAFRPQGRIELTGCVIPYTKPDLIHESARIAVYLDGSPHFALEVLRRDQLIRHALEDDGWIVVEVPIGDMENGVLMARIRDRISKRIAKIGAA